MLEFITSFFFGYQIAKKISTPNSKIHNKIPKIRIKSIQFLPTFKIYIKGKVIHFHHWIYMSLVLIFSFYGSSEILVSPIIKGIVSGTIIQGLTFPDWKKIIFEDKGNRSSFKGG